MFKHNKLRFWLGMVSIAKKDDYYVLTERTCFVARTYYDAKDNGWWCQIYHGSKFATAEAAYEAYKRSRLRPV